MARASTVARVHRAVLEMAHEVGPGGLTMEGIAGRAGVGKQTLYRSWSSPSSIVFDALLGRTLVDGEVSIPDTGDLRADVATVVEGAVEEMTAEPGRSLLRHMAAAVLLDESVASDFRERLLGPQLTAVRRRLGQGGVADPVVVAERLLAPVHYRWSLGVGELTVGWARRHVDEVLAAADRDATGPRPDAK